MFEPLFAWLESTALSVWIGESPLLFAFPGILAAHTLIAVALLILRETIRRIHGGSAISGTTKALAAASLVAWAATITAGRLLAYTCSRLTLDLSC